MKKIFALLLMVTFLVPGIHTTYGAVDQKRYAESDQELISAETALNAVVVRVTREEIRVISGTAGQGREMSDDKLQKIAHLKNIKGYNDLRTDRTFSEVLVELESKNYEVDEDVRDLYQEIYLYRESNPGVDTKEVVKIFNSRAGLKQRDVSGQVGLLFNPTAEAYTISYSSWTKLTTAEKILVASNPVSALMTNAIQKKAYDYTTQKFGSNGLGDKSDGYRHGMWNALMTRDIGKAWAEAISTAHEDRPKAELEAKQPDGYTGYQHKAMDLNNNKIGRDLIAWYEFSFNCSDDTVKSRVSSKLTNKTGGITWLHN